MEKRYERSRERRELGFTLVEILMVLVLLGLIATAITASLMKRTREAQRRLAKLKVNDLYATAEQFRVGSGGECPLVETLVKQKLIDASPLDPWNHPLVLECPGTHSDGLAEVTSWGPDGRAGTEDDIVSWKP